MDLIAKSSSENVSFEVKVILALPTSIDIKSQTNAIKKQVETPRTTTETEKEESIVISDL